VKLLQARQLVAVLGQEQPLELSLVQGVERRVERGKDCGSALVGFTR